MGWFEPVSAYCERTGPEYWAEPVNALSNAAFLLAAAVMAARLRGARLPLGWAMVAVLALIGLGSFLFHTHANRLTGLMDVLPILAFILLYIFAATRDYLGARPLLALLAVAGFFPFAAALVPVFAMLPGLGSSAGYAAGAAVDPALCRAFVAPRAGHVARHGGRGGDIDRVAVLSQHRSGDMRCACAGNAFHVAHPQCRHAGLDDRGLSAYGGAGLMARHGFAHRGLNGAGGVFVLGYAFEQSGKRRRKRRRGDEQEHSRPSARRRFRAA
jgi:uncharacterized membrane protein (GlpM family)